LGDAPPLAGEQRLEAAVQVGIQPVLQGLAMDLLRSAHVGESLAFPNRSQGQQSAPWTLGFVPVVQLLPLLQVAGRQALNPDSSIHDTLPSDASS
jgi:hypothetical protein